jgi:hypothetical protein
MSGGTAVNTAQDPGYVNPGAPIYIVTGGGGRSLHPLGTTPSYEVLSQSTFHVTMVNVADSTLTLKAVERNGNVFDTMTLTKTPHSVTLTEYLTETRPDGVLLRWRVSAGSDVVGFHVYRGLDIGNIATRLTPSRISGGPEYTYLDTTAEPGQAYYYALGAVDGLGREQRVGIVVGSRGGPFRFAAERPRPNPSDGETEIRFTLDRSSNIGVAVYNVAGRTIRSIAVSGTLGPGPHGVRWDGRDRNGHAVPAGLYFAVVQSGNRSVTARVLRFP